MFLEDHPELSIIVPTFEEAPNIPILTREIYEKVTPTIPGWELIIVDDNSQDGTADICKGLVREGYPVRLFVRKNEKGLATAVMEGFTRARAPVIVVMDADLSHRPDAVPLIYSSIQNGAEFAVGSRYIPGGGTDDRWTVYRYLNSKTASLLAMPLISVSDPMSGFFGLQRSLLERCRNLSPVGYKIGLEILVKCRPKKITEIPIHFHTRVLGKSKLTLKQQLLYLYHLYLLYVYKMRRKQNTDGSFG